MVQERLRIEHNGQECSLSEKKENVYKKTGKGNWCSQLLGMLVIKDCHNTDECHVILSGAFM
eukprot:c56878_g1_i1 orf=112-297(+)